MKRPRMILNLILISSLYSFEASGAGLEGAAGAMRNGASDVAEKEIRPEAETGNPEAQSLDTK